MLLCMLQKATLTHYEGDTDTAGLCHGRGQALFSSGQSYEGDWQHGHMQGQGRIQFPDQIAYEGSFLADSISGSGVYTWGADAVYEGRVLNGQRHGQGKLAVSGSPVIYEGQWQLGQRHGKGVLYYNEARTAYYDGEWVDDMKHGQGTSAYPSGNVYVGEWAHDQRQGHGTMQWSTVQQRYTGQWLQGLPDGFGEHVWEQQRPAAAAQGSNHAMHIRHNRYVGMFQEGQRHGQGTLLYSTGARYEGQWRAGRKHGQGVYVFEDGSVFSGQFVDDRPVLSSGAVLGAASTFSGGGGSSSRNNSPSKKVAQSEAEQAAAAACEQLGENAALCGTDGAGSSAAAAESAGRSAGLASAAGAAGAAPVSSDADPDPGSSNATVSGKSTRGEDSTSAKPSKPAAATKGAPATSTRTAAATTSAKSSAASTRSKPASAHATAAAGREDPPAVQGLPPAAFNTSGVGPVGFGPAVSVMQLYISDLLQEFDSQPATTYKLVSNLLVAYNTELRLLYDRYSAAPAALLDSSLQQLSWALQACQVWELLRDARLLCRHVCLQQVCQMVARTTTPPPAVMQQRQEGPCSAPPGAEAALQQTWACGDCREAPATQLLFRDFCELLVRVAAARYPLLPGLDVQLQQVISCHLLPLLRSPAKPVAGGPRATSLTAAAHAAGSAANSNLADSGCVAQQLLRSPEVIAYLQGRATLLQELFAAMQRGSRCSVPAGQQQHMPESSSQHPAAAQAACALDADAPVTTSSEVVTGAQHCLEHRSQQAPTQADGCCSQAAVTVREVVVCLQETGVLEQWQLSAEVVAAYMLHDVLAVTDPQGARAYIEEADTEATCTADAQEPGCRNSNTDTSSDVGCITKAAALQHELLFWMDAPLLLQDLLWGFMRLSMVPTACTVQHQSVDQPTSSTNTTQQQQLQQQQPKQAAAQSGLGLPVTAPCLASQQPLEKQDLQRFVQWFIQGSMQGLESALMLLRLQALLHGLFETVLGVVEGHSTSSSPEPQDQSGQPKQLQEQEEEEEEEVVQLDGSTPEPEDTATADDLDDCCSDAGQGSGDESAGGSEDGGMCADADGAVPS